MKPIQIDNRENSIDQQQPIRKKRVFNILPDLFENNQAIKDTEKNIQLKPGHSPLKQNARPFPPLHLQEDVGRELEKLIKARHLEKVSNVDEDCFVNSVGLLVKNDKQVKIAVDSRKLIIVALSADHTCRTWTKY